MMKKPLIVVAIVVVGIVAYMALASKPVTSPVTQNTVAPSEVDGETPEGSMPATDGETVEVEVSGKAFSFTPDEITLNQGDKVKLTFTSGGGMHDFVVDELNIKTEIVQTGESAVVEFTVPNTPGTFEFYCSVADHKKMGMVGTLIIK